MTCIFCDILERRAPASFIYEDQDVAGFMSLHPTAAGECLVIPKQHVDHFVDLPDIIAQQIILVAQHIGRQMRAVFPLERVGYVVHGYGVAHAHLVIVPQQGPHHLTSDRFARVEGDCIVFDLSRVPEANRSTLNKHAHLLSEGLSVLGHHSPTKLPDIR